MVMRLAQQFLSQLEYLIVFPSLYFSVSTLSRLHAMISRHLMLSTHIPAVIAAARSRWTTIHLLILNTRVHCLLQRGLCVDLFAMLFLIILSVLAVVSRRILLFVITAHFLLNDVRFTTTFAALLLNLVLFVVIIAIGIADAPQLLKDLFVLR